MKPQSTKFVTILSVVLVVLGLVLSATQLNDQLTAVNSLTSALGSTSSSQGIKFEPPSLLSLLVDGLLFQLPAQNISTVPILMFWAGLLGLFASFFFRQKRQ